MYKDLIHRIVVMLAFLAAMASFAWNLFMGRDLLYSAYMALCVLLAVSVILLLAFQNIAQVLFRYLNEQRQVQEAARRREEEEQRKLES